jgi:hypothetical protein
MNKLSSKTLEQRAYKSTAIQGAPNFQARTLSEYRTRVLLQFVSHQHYCLRQCLGSVLLKAEMNACSPENAPAAA